jgi:hypothetical protein
MENNDRQFEKYLGEFEPRKPRALPALSLDRKIWPRRVAAAAAISFLLGASLWSLRKNNGSDGNVRFVRKLPNAKETNSPPQPLGLLPLRQLALEDPIRMDEQLTAASRKELPDFRGNNSTLRVLTKE